jgi:hypothetical protein
MTTVLRKLADLHAPFAVPPQTYRADCGRRRTFLSQRDADAYAQGWNAHPDWPAGGAAVMSAPWRAGWFDREHDEELRDDYRRLGNDEGEDR